MRDRQSQKRIEIKEREKKKDAKYSESNIEHGHELTLPYPISLTIKYYAKFQVIRRVMV